MPRKICLYEWIARCPYPKSYVAKFTLLIFVAMHGSMIFAGVAWSAITHRPNVGQYVSPVEVIPGFLLGAIMLVVIIRHMLRPIILSSFSLSEYMDRRRLPDLPTQYTDEVGLLMANLQKSLACLDGLLTEQEKQANTDALTGLGNRSWCNAKIENEVARACQIGTPFCLGMIDLDRFKQMNDQHGHQNGDLILQHFAQTVNSVLRGGESLARWGGDEFVLLLPRCSEADAKAVLQRIQDKLKDNPVHLSDQASVTIQMSVGVYKHDGSEGAKETFLKADSALYAAKRQGRNRAVVYTPDLQLISEKLAA